MQSKLEDLFCLECKNKRAYKKENRRACLTKKKKFLETLGELKKKMILLGHSGYQNFCKEFYENFSGEERENMI